MGRIYKTARGKSLDMASLIAKQEKTRAKKKLLMDEIMKRGTLNALYKHQYRNKDKKRIYNVLFCVKELEIPGSNMDHIPQHENSDNEKSEKQKKEFLEYLHGESVAQVPEIQYWNIQAMMKLNPHPHLKPVSLYDNNGNNHDNNSNHHDSHANEFHHESRVNEGSCNNNGNYSKDNFSQHERNI